MMKSKIFFLTLFVFFWVLPVLAQEVDTAWVRHYDGPGNGSDQANTLARDSSGNIYVTGYSVGSGTGADYATIKYSPSGDTLWVRRYNGPGNSNDQASALAVDKSGNVCVTGYSYGSGTNYDYATIKYSSSGDTLWIGRYNGPGNDADWATALALDNSGNVYVTGYSYGSGTSYDYTTIKYSANGDTLWVRRYNGTGNSYDYARALAVDDSGNVYVTGYSTGSGTSSDYTTIKYSASGDTLWVRSYNGPGNGSDYAYALALDSTGNVYVTGSSPGSGTGRDYATIKYAPNGDTIWVKRYNYAGSFDDFAFALEVDDSGYVYVTGNSATIKYLPSGDTAWTRIAYSTVRYDLQVDQSGNVYATGPYYSGSDRGFSTIKYSPNGDTLWEKKYFDGVSTRNIPNALLLDDSGNVYVTGIGGSNDYYYEYDYITIKYASNGDTLWLRSYNGPASGYDQATALEVDESGNIYVTGKSGSRANPDYATIKYASNGDTLWVRRYNGPGNGFDQATDLSVDGSANVYVTGYSTGSGTSYDYATIKYAPNGDTVWVRSYNGQTGYRIDLPTDLSIDKNGNVYVTGSIGGYEYNDYATIKYAPNGDTLWIRRYSGPGNHYDIARALAIDDSGNVYVTGSSVGTSYDYATIKYSSAGDTLWVRRYNGPANSQDQALALAVDNSGNVYVTGYSTGSGTSYDYATIKYAPNGDTLWVRRYNGPGNGNDQVSALEVDVSGNVYVTGYSAGSGTSYDYATIKYAPNGDTVWVRRYNGPASGYDLANALVVDKSGNLYVTGTSGGSGTSSDFATIKYSSSGDSMWIMRYNGPANSADTALDLAVDGNGNVYVTGSSYGSGTQNYTTIKYVQGTCLAKPGDANGDGKILLSDIVTLINFLFKGAPAPNPWCRGDVNKDGDVLLSDIVYIINFLFKSGPTPKRNNECCL